VTARQRTVLFDLDGTLIDSDAALLAPFDALGVPVDRRPPLGLPLGEACDLAGITVERYLAEYDPMASHPFPGVDAMLGRLERWGVCSNKERRSGQRELARLGWRPDVALFSDDFGGRQKQLDPVLLVLELAPDDAVFIGDTAHDRTCAHVAGVAFALAGWNPRAVPEPGDHVLGDPAEVLDLVTR
jgi:phosphoglycolate phosphatase-like HAD superfamily hydrolase